ncbi:MAG: DUF11 domain-containing protein [Dehalococcoidia bacterium]
MAGVVDCTGGNINAGATATIVVRGTVTAAPGTITNFVEVDPFNQIVESNEANNTFSLNTTVVASSTELGILKSADVAVIGPGGVVTYTITVANLSATTAVSGVTVRDILPAGTGFVSATGTNGFNCNFAAGTVTCTGGSIAASSNQVITLKVTAPTTAGLFTNTAEVDPFDTIPEPNAVPNTATAGVTVVLPDLAVVKTANGLPGPGVPVPVNSNVTFDIAVANLGPSTVSNIVVRDVLPAGFTFQNFTNQGGFFCSHNAGTVLCSNGTIPAPGAVTISFVAKAPATAGPASNTAEVDPFNAIIESNEGNNASTVTMSVEGSPNLTISKSAPAIVTGGTSFQYVISVTNNGTAAIPAATVVLVSDTLPAGVTFSGFLATGGFTCAEAAGVITCTRAGYVSAKSATSSFRWSRGPRPAWSRTPPLLTRLTRLPRATRATTRRRLARRFGCPT